MKTPPVIAACLFPLFIGAMEASAADRLPGRIFFTATERQALEQGTWPPVQSAPPRRFDGALWREGRLIALWLDREELAPAALPEIRLIHGTPSLITTGQPLLPGQMLP
ncbi:MAG: hypothetical protein LBB76_04520 [Azoarcus sp.]|jgi:hypothetical protein|nr:hypothetical protein [Azoarcus sp.]